MKRTSILKLLAATLFFSVQALAAPVSPESAKAASGLVVGENVGVPANSPAVKTGPQAAIRKILAGAARLKGLRIRTIPNPDSRPADPERKGLKKRIAGLGSKLHKAIAPIEKLLEAHEGLIWAGAAGTVVFSFFLPTADARIIDGAGTTVLFLHEAYKRHLVSRHDKKD